MPVFYAYRKWKAFNVWKDNVRSKKVQSAKRELEENLFFLSPVSMLKFCVCALGLGFVGKIGFEYSATEVLKYSNTY